MMLSRYLIKSFVMRFLALLFGLVVFLQTLDLLAQANVVLEGGGPPAASLFRYVLLRSPSLVETVAPLAALLGALTAFVVMATNSEIIAMRAAGRSVLSLVGGLSAVGIIFAVLLFVFSDYVVVRANTQLEEWRDNGFKTTVEEPVVGENSWLTEGNTILRAGKIQRGGEVIRDLRIFELGENAEVVDILSIRLAIWEDGKWSVFEPRRVGGTRPANAPVVWQTNMRPEHFARFANQAPNQLSLNALQEYVGETALGSRPGYFYATWFQQKIAGPLALALMPLLAGIAAFAHHRQGSSVIAVVWGITFGFLFVVIDNILLAMGQFGSLPPAVAAWLPIALFATVGLWIVFNFENTGART
ncbi:MAG: LPS export ABC transporter permease LptG [Rhodospirillaceae bacterium]